MEREPGSRRPQGETEPAGAAGPPTQGRSRTTPEMVKFQFAKTASCHYWPRCRHGDQCVYAHGDHELRQRPNLTKTSLCTAWQAGRCVSKSRHCPFAHGYYEMKSTEAFKQEKKKKGAAGAEDDQQGPPPSALPGTSLAPFTQESSSRRRRARRKTESADSATQPAGCSSMASSSSMNQMDVTHVCGTQGSEEGVLQLIHSCNDTSEQSEAAHSLPVWVGGEADARALETAASIPEGMAITEPADTIVQSSYAEYDIKVIARMQW